MLFKRGLWRGLTYVFTFVLILSIMVGVLLETFRTFVDEIFKTQSEQIVVEGGATYSHFKPDERYLNADGTGNSTALLKGEIELGRRHGYEGAVLLKNNVENNKPTLPLDTGSSVTLLGKRSHTTILGSKQGIYIGGPIVTLATALSGTSTNFPNELGTGTADVYSKIENINFKGFGVAEDGLTDAGAGFKLNPDMIKKYGELVSQEAYKCTYSADQPARDGNDAKEPGRSLIEGVSLTGYKDAAILVFGRPSTEATDFAKPESGKRGPLALSTEEREIVNYATENFDKVIVLINTNSAMEIQELKDNPGVDAILWIGHPGSFGCLGIADVLCGRVSPSGGLSDIYVADNMSAPAMMNFGNYRLAGDVSSTYVVEAEGLYVGYRYYETRYNDIVLGKGNANSNAGVRASKGNWNYNEEVTYSFGYGMSYSDFKFEMVGDPEVTKKDHEIYLTFNVKVTNEGDKAAKTSVQIYGQAPYEHGVTKTEKSAVQLVAFDKTPIIQPKANAELKIEVDVQNIASYDNTFANADGTVGSYILDEGDYYFAIGNGAHNALNNILTKQGVEGNLLDNPGDENLVYKWTYDVPGDSKVDGTTFGVSKNGVQVQNQIPYADWNYYQGGTPVTYLSRTDWAGTYPKEYANLTPPASMHDHLNKNYYTVKTNQDTSKILWGQQGNLKFYELAMADWNDARWETLLNQLTLEESMVLSAYGGPRLPEANSIGLLERDSTENTGNGVQAYTFGSKVIDKNAPWSIDKKDKNAEMPFKVFGSAPLVASSFSPKLMYDTGKFLGNQALFAGLPILWGPGGNTHRTAYNGRNGEYYSEDPVLSGVCVMEFAIGALDKGLIAAPKHYAFNDQETNRSGIAPFMTEQRAREVELRAFQIPFEATKYDKLYNKNTGMLGMMTSFSKIGAVECTSSVGLLNGIAVGEWGFKGYTVTDIGDDTNLYSAMVIAGCTGYDTRSGTRHMTFKTMQKDFSDHGSEITTARYAKDADFQNALKMSNKRLIYTLCQSNLMNVYGGNARVETLVTWWHVTYVVFIVVAAVLTAGAASMYVLSELKSRKKEKQDV
mgnify:CR=1 FL=1